ncbi:hypothetical protein BB558_004163 [Smittium angustum]|uniref:RecA family profile 1 domain-containing protein n=1 Tax=Smittium angustum TaxID=133377 RepID=A0A2U1J429_SMIAN|nr:hypothetical protein BB558_004163 [Smittium angustum]
MNALEKKELYLSTGDSRIDKILGGGIRSGILTEIVGESSAGKTQLCFQLCLTAQLPLELGGLGGEVVYILTEEKFSLKRMEQLIPLFYRRLGIDYCSESFSSPQKVSKSNTNSKNQSNDCESRDNIDKYAIRDILKKIHIRFYFDKDQLSFGVIHQLPDFVEKNNVKLIVIDSIAAVMRFHYESISSHINNEMELYYERNEMLISIANSLKKTAFKNNCAVVCVNQVSDKILDLNEKLSNFMIPSTNHNSNLDKTPALGPKWASSVNAQIFLKLKRANNSSNTITNDEVNPESQVSANRRWITGSRIPWAGQETEEFYISGSGIHAVHHS